MVQGMLFDDGLDKDHTILPMRIDLRLTSRWDILQNVQEPRAYPFASPFLHLAPCLGDLEQQLTHST